MASPVGAFVVSFVLVYASRLSMWIRSFMGFSGHSSGLLTQTNAPTSAEADRYVSPTGTNAKHPRYVSALRGSPCWTRTNDLAVNSRSLLPTELRRNIFSFSFVGLRSPPATPGPLVAFLALPLPGKPSGFPRARLWAISTHCVETLRRRPD